MSKLENEINEGWITNSSNQKLYCRYWADDVGVSQPSALVFIAHGAGEHCLCYNELAAELIEKNLYVFSHDHVGHGQSEGDRLHIDDFNTYVQDVFQHIEIIQKKIPNVPCFIIGHSMGGAIAIMSAIDKPSYFKGVILIAPAIVPSPDAIQPWKLSVGKVVARVCPQAPLVKLDATVISRDPVEVKKYQEDPLVYHGGLKAKWGLCMINALKFIEENLSTIAWPYLNLHGDQDKLTDIQGSKDMHEKSISSDKTFKIYEGYYHQLHKEPGGDGAGVRKEILNWITDRI